jgi:hypothetical protein
MPLSYTSVFRSANAPDVVQAVEEDWSAFVAGFAKPAPETIPKAELPLWSPARFDPPYRLKANVVGVYALGFDVDENPVPTADALRAGLAPYLAAAHSSSRATATTSRWRAFIALSRPVSAQEYYRLWAAVAAALPFPVAKNSGEPARAWYVPRRGPDGYYETIATDGAPLDVEEWLARAPAIADTTPALAREAAPADVTARHRAAALALGAAWPATGRHEAQLALAGALRREGYDAETALEVLCATCAAAGDEDRPKREATIRATYAKPLDGAITGWTRLAALVDPGVVEAARTMFSPHADGVRALEADLAVTLGSKVEGVHADDPLADVKPAATEGLRVDWGGWDEIIKPPVYLLDGLIPESTVVCFFAEGGSVKSWTALGLAHAVATGQDFLGRRVLQGPAVILDYEDGRYEFQRRAKILGFSGPVPDLGYRYDAGSLSQEELWRDVVKLIVARSVRLVVVDALSSGMPGDADENDGAFAQGVKYASKIVERLQQHGHPVNVLFVHHANKTGGMRGHSSVRDQCDVVFRFDSVSEDDEAGIKRMRMVCAKPGPQRKPLPVNVELSDGGLTTFEDEEEPTKVEKNAPEHKIRAAILLAFEQRERFETVKKLAGEIGLREGAVSTELGALVALRQVRKLPGKQGYVLDSPDRRRARVLAQVTNNPFVTAAQLAHDAGVETDEVEALARAGVIVKSGEGRWITLAP